MKLTIKTEAAKDAAMRHVLDLWKREKDRDGITLEVLPVGLTLTPMTPPQRRKLFSMMNKLALDIGHESWELQEHFEARGPTGRWGKPKRMKNYSAEEASAMIEIVYKTAAEAGFPQQ